MARLSASWKQTLALYFAEYQNARADRRLLRALAEQFVGQKILAAQGPELCYWSRAARGSTAEMDFLTVVNKTIHPVEVKSDASGRLRSLHLLLKTYPSCGQGLVFSMAPFAELPAQKVKFLPLYFAHAANRTVSS